MVSHNAQVALVQVFSVLAAIVFAMLLAAAITAVTEHVKRRRDEQSVMTRPRPARPSIPAQRGGERRAR